MAQIPLVGFRRHHIGRSTRPHYQGSLHVTACSTQSELHQLTVSATTGGRLHSWQRRLKQAIEANSSLHAAEAALTLLALRTDNPATVDIS
ncbi:hypothetical protein [Oryza sativa Japonica Group]|uniref:Uncharacterized protein n=1 Tax=Oryza sativa subsp. japonica TaxID=39947 RepID=Q5QMV6_ORYSJ|nr:hypothetical protein [Oryza sativa Japonica Group]